MKELSLNVLDIAENSYKAGATLTEIYISEADGVLTLTVKDDGHGMKKETLLGVTDPFFTTRKTRTVGLGLPLLKLEAEMTGGELKVESRHEDEFPDCHGTAVTATFYTEHIDCPPLGDVTETLVTLIQGHPAVDTLFVHTKGDKKVTLDTREMRAILGEVPLNTFEVLSWIRESLNESYTEFNENK